MIARYYDACSRGDADGIAATACAAASTALRPASGAIQIFDGNTVLYQLNGLGPNGSIKGGKPSEQRLQLMRREALELALYTFRYLPDVESVVTLLPPPPPKPGAETSPASAGILNTEASPDQMEAIFYRPGDLKPQLQIPLGNTVAATAPAPDKMGGAEGKMVDQLTMSNLFKWSLTRSQDFARAARTTPRSRRASWPTPDAAPD